MEAAAVVELGLRPADFWDLTQRQFQAMLDRHVDREIRHERSFHTLTALFANANFKLDEPATVDSFAPPLRGAPHEPPFDGPAFLKPCRECKVPRWQGHLPDCQTGQRQFQATLGKVRRATERAQEMAAAHGRGFLEPKN